MANKPRSRAGPPTPETGQDVMFLLGRLVEGQDALNRRMDEMTDTQRQQAAALEELSRDNAAQHAETASKLGALGEGLSDVKRRLGALEERETTPKPPSGGTSEGRKENGFENAGKIAAFFKTYTPWFYAFGVAVVGAVVAWMEHRSKGGGPPTP